MLDRKWFLGAALITLSPTGWGQTHQRVMKEGDTILGIGAVSSFENVIVNDSKVWISETDTDFGSTQNDGVVLWSGFVTLREGIPLSAPTGALLDEWNNIEITGRGDLGQAIQIKPASGPLIDGVLWNFKTVVATDTPITSPVFSQPTTWDQIHFVKVTDSSIFIAGEVDNPALSRLRENTLMRYDLDAQGNTIGNEVLATEGMVIPALGLTVRSMGPSQAVPPAISSVDTNSKGDLVCFVNGTTASVIALNLETELARTGEPSPVPLRTWQTISDSRVAINDRGDIVFTGQLEGDTATNWLMVKNGEKFVQTGDVLPDIGTLEPQASADNEAPVFVTNAGDVFWRAEDGADAFMRNLTPLVRVGSVVDGLAVVKLETDSQCFAVSPNGRFFVGNIEVVGQLDMVLFVDFGLVLDIPGCHGNPGKLARVSGDARVGEVLEFSMDNGMAPGDSAKILFSTRKRNPGSECGVLTPVGEIIARRLNPVGVLVLPPWDGVNPSKASVAIPNDVALVDAVFFAQGTFRSPGNVRMTNGLRIEIGAP